MNVRSIERAVVQRELEIPVPRQQYRFFAGVKPTQGLLYTSFNLGIRLGHFEWLWCWWRWVENGLSLKFVFNWQVAFDLGVLLTGTLTRLEYLAPVHVVVPPSLPEFK